MSLTGEVGLQYAKQGITVNAICPGTHRSDIVNAFDEDVVNALEFYSPMGRISEASEISWMSLRENGRFGGWRGQKRRFANGTRSDNPTPLLNALVDSLGILLSRFYTNIMVRE